MTAEKVLRKLKEKRKTKTSERKLDVEALMKKASTSLHFTRALSYKEKLEQDKVYNLSDARGQLIRMANGEQTPNFYGGFYGGSLTTPIPNQYAKIGTAYTYTFPSNTFAGTGLTYTAYVNQPIVGRELPSWLNFNGATRTFSGTATDWWHARDLQIVVEADESGTKSYCIFLLSIGFADNTGRPCWRSGSTPNHVITTTNMGTFDTNTVSAGQWVVIDQNITKDPITSGFQVKIDSIRARGGYIVWRWNNVNGLKGHLVNAFDFDKVFAGETIAIDFSAGNTRAFNPYGRLWRGIKGKEIYVTNYDVPGNITPNNFSDSPAVSPIRCNRATDQMSDEHIRFVGQPNNHVPYVNGMYGITLLGGIASQIDGSRGHVWHSFMQIKPSTIGCHWKPNTTKDNGDRRPWLNRNGWDMNQEYTYITNCMFQGGEGEHIYLGGGGWGGASVKIYHTNPDGTKKMVLSNGVSVQEYHSIRRYNSTHRYISIENNIFLQAGWDAIQTRCVIGNQRVMYNYIFQTAYSHTTNMVQAEGIITDGGVGEVAYNYIEQAYNCGIRFAQLGMDSIHHNIIFDIGFNNYGNNTDLDPAGGGIGLYSTGRGHVNDDVPQDTINSFASWDPATNYNFDSFQHVVRVKYNGKAYSSKLANNLNKNPETNPTYWEDTREGDSYVARPDIDDSELFTKTFNNTCIQCKTNTAQMFISTPAAQQWFYNNLFINCALTTLSLPSASNKGTNIALIGVTLSTYFVDPAKKDWRLKAGASAINAGTNVTAWLTGEGAFQDGFKDFAGGNHHATTPSVGAFENGAGTRRGYYWAVNGLVAGAPVGPVTPPPITINAGADRTFNLPLNSVSITAVKSDPARVLTTIAWSQISGPGDATILNGATLTATFADLNNVGTYKFRIHTVDEYGQTAFDEVNVTVNAEAIVTVTTFQWYIADDANGTNKAPIAGANKKSLDITPYIGQNKWFARGERPVAKSGILIGQESLSNWINIA